MSQYQVFSRHCGGVCWLNMKNQSNIPTGPSQKDIFHMEQNERSPVNKILLKDVRHKGVVAIFSILLQTIQLVKNAFLICLLVFTFLGKVKC